MSSPSSNTVQRVAQEFLKESRKMRGSNPAGGAAAIVPSSEQRIATLEETVRTLEARLLTVEQRATDGGVEQQYLLLKKAETVVQALLLENQRLRSQANQASLPNTPGRVDSARSEPLPQARPAPSPTPVAPATFKSAAPSQLIAPVPEDNVPSPISQRRIVEKKRAGYAQSVQEENLPSRVNVEYPRGYDPTKRRYSISSESYSPEQFKDVEAIVIPKTDDEKAQIRRTVKGNVLFKNLDADQLDEVANVMSRREVAAGVNVVSQGSFVDENEMYLIQEGECDVLYGKDVVARLTAGGAFGEIALMYSCPRTATVKTVSPCKLWVLDRKSFRRILMQESIRRRDLHQNFLQKVPMLKGLFPYERTKIADSLETEYFKKGDVVIRQGQTDADKFYLIEKGEVEVTKSDSTGKNPPVFVMTLGPGGYFGELALLRNEPRAATVSATTDLKVLTISREHFSQVLAPCEEILKRHMTDYKSYQDLLESVTSLGEPDHALHEQEDEDEWDEGYPETRGEMIQYIVDNESDYVFTLGQGYRRALQEHAEKLGFDPAKLDIVFSGLSDLLTQHTSFEQKLKEASANENALLSELYLQLLPPLQQVYEKFSANMENALNTLKELAALPHVAEFLQVCDAEAEDSLPDLLAAIQARIFHVLNQLKHLVELTPSHHLDASNLSLVVKKAEALHASLSGAQQ